MAGWFVLLGVLVGLFVILGVLAHAGYFSDLRIRTSVPASLPHRVAYTVHRGPYRNVGGLVENLAVFAPKQTRFCVFYDDPKEVSCVQWEFFCM